MSARRWLLLLLAPLVGALIVIAVALLAGVISRAEGAEGAEGAIWRRSASSCARTGSPVSPATQPARRAT